MVRCLLTVLLKIHTDGLPPESKYHHTSQGFCNPEVKGKNKTRNKQKKQQQKQNQNQTKKKIRGFVLSSIFITLIQANNHQKI